MELTITLDNLDESIKQLRELGHKLEKFPEEVAMESAQRVKYSMTNAYVERDEGKITIVNEGEGIAFAEFGAGFTAQTADIEDFHTEPGIYSADHAGTFQKWIEDGKDPDDYPLNRNPKMRMQNEALRLERETESKARTYFDN